MSKAGLPKTESSFTARANVLSKTSIVLLKFIFVTTMGNSVVRLIQAGEYSRGVAADGGWRHISNGAFRPIACQS